LKQKAERKMIVEKSEGYEYIVDDGRSTQQPEPTCMLRIPNPASSVNPKVTIEDRIKAIDAYVAGKEAQLSRLAA
jgi:hypothetical protein